MSSPLDSQVLRRILGHYPTGVCAVTAMGPDGPLGMIAGSFTSVSLDPPLVAFLPDRSSSTWPKLEATSRFCVNVLSDRQHDVCRSLSSRAANKFESIPYRLSPAGLPIPEGAIAWIDCRIYAVHEAGDHYIAIGEVEALGVEQVSAPMIFFRGMFGSFSAPISAT